MTELAPADWEIETDALSPKEQEDAERLHRLLDYPGRHDQLTTRRVNLEAELADVTAQLEELEASYKPPVAPPVEVAPAPEPTPAPEPAPEPAEAPEEAPVKEEEAPKKRAPRRRTTKSE